MEKEPLKHNDSSKYRETYVVGPNKDHIAKVPKEKREKQYPFGSVSYPSAPYTLLKFGSTNVNKVDMKNYEALPPLVRDEFTSHTRMIQGVIVQERVMNYDGTPSLSIEQHTRTFGKIRNEHFWRKVQEFKEIFLAEKRPLLGAFHRGSNVMVKKISENEWTPIVIDFKRLGGRSYLFQPNLSVPGGVHKKFLRQFDEFEQKYKPEDM